MRKKALVDPLLLEAALLGLRQMHQQLDQKIAELRHRLRIKGASGEPKAHHVSAAGKSRIASAQKQRWEAFRKAKQAAATTPKAARTQSTSPVARKPKPVHSAPKPRVRKPKATRSEPPAQSLPEGTSSRQ